MSANVPPASASALFSHIVVEKAVVYRGIMEVFATAKRQFRLHLRPDEVLAEGRWPTDTPTPRGIAAGGYGTRRDGRGLLSPGWDVSDRSVYVCENSAIVAVAAERLSSTCAPLVCTDGMPSAAQRTLLAQLSASGARLLYHGDWDWEGIGIGNFVMRAFGARPWRFSAADYRAACQDVGVALAGDGRVEASWDEELAGAMDEHGVLVHEEAVVDALMTDLASPAV